MARTLSATLETGLAGPVIQPLFLVQMGFSAALYLSSRGDIADWNGIAWTGSGIAVGQISQDNAGIIQTNLTMLNGDASISALLLSEGARNIAVSIWKSDGTALAVGDPELLFEGVTNGASIDRDQCRIALRSDADGLNIACRQPVGPPVFNHIPAPGTELAWGGEKIDLDPVRDPGADIFRINFPEVLST